MYPDLAWSLTLSRQAVKEIAGRTVMTTAKFRGTDDSESTLDVAASQAAQYSMKQPESAVAQAIGGSTARTAETPMSSRIDPPTTDALGRDTVEVSIALSDDQSEVVEPSTKKETAGMEVEFPSAKFDAVSPSVEPDATARAASQSETTPKIRPTMEPIASISPSEVAATLFVVCKPLTLPPLPSPLPVIVDKNNIAPKTPRTM